MAENWIEGLPANFKTLGTNLQFKKRTGLQRFGQIDLIAKLKNVYRTEKRAKWTKMQLLKIKGLKKEKKNNKKG